MAASQGHPHTTSSSHDALEMDQYINYDPLSLLQSSSSYNLDNSRTISGSTPFDTDEYATSLLIGQSNQQTFAGPSHQYELHKQQTGLPMGALANALAINQNDHIVHGQAQRMYGFPSTDSYLAMNTTDDGFDFNTAPSQTLGPDMDIDFAASINDANSDYINPNAISSEESSLTSIAPKQRAWPGMHQQQAKAQAEAQRQQTLAQQQQTQSISRPASQRPLSTSVPAKDPIVEERISRLLNQMRHSSVTSSNDDSPTPTAHGNTSHLGRAKKDEEDMDEDERLLASEEGKRLSSKERRQLRNKVSARAFRSRRKEYIGQLEGEIAAKTAEADELRAKNQALMAENTRLTDLTRMLVESPAFSALLDEMSGADKQSSTQAQQETTVPKMEDAHQSHAKDVNPLQSPRLLRTEQEDAQVGVTLLPESYINFNAGNTMWNHDTEFGLYDAQVYALTSMPLGPAVDNLDESSLSGKPSDLSICFASVGPKHDAPNIEHPFAPCHEPQSQEHCVGNLNGNPLQLDETDPVYALYNDEISSPSKSTLSDPQSIVENSFLTKSTDHFESTVVDNVRVNDKVDPVAMERFARLCAMLEAASHRVAAVTSHL
ncbi:MAG: hypothetical protein Q9226_003397 [Calogaya cf. arnoldii]